MALSSLSSSTSYSLSSLFQQAYGKSSAGEVTIGRGPDCVLMVTAQQAAQAGTPLMLSRLHAKLAVRDGTLQLWDCGSVNGTYCNTQQLPRHAWKVLHDGDVLTFGGPPEIRQDGVLQPNPWRFRVRNLHQFLASFAPGARPTQPAGAPPQQQQHAAAEVFRFSAGAVAGGDAEEPGSQEGEHDGVAAAHPATAAPPEQPAPGGGHEPTQEIFRILGSGAVAQVSAPGGSQQGSPPDPEPAGAEPRTAAGQPEGAGARDSCGSSPNMPRTSVRHEAVMEGEQQQQQQPGAAVAAFSPAAAAAGAAQEGGVDVIDLTMTDEDSPAARVRRRAHVSPRLPARARPPPTAPAVVVVDESSPPKRREHDALQLPSGHQKRPKPAYTRVDDNMAGPSAAAAAAPAAAQPESAAAAGAGAGSSDLANIQSQFICAICQEMLVKCRSMVCGHNFCGECLAGWLANKKDCPTCRTVGTAPPVPNVAIDNICNDVLEKQMSTDDLEERQRKKQSWEAQKKQLEQALKAPWERGGGGSGGRRSSRGAQQREEDFQGELRGAVLQMVLGGGPVVPPDLLFGGLHGLVGMGPAMAGQAGRGGPVFDPLGQMGGVPRPPPLPARAPQPPPPPQQPRRQFKVEYTPVPVARPARATPCAGCHRALATNELRIGVAEAPASRRQAASFNTWYHLDCLPRPYWVEMRVAGVHNMRGVSVADQARIRTLQHTR